MRKGAGMCAHGLGLHGPYCVCMCWILMDVVLYCVDVGLLDPVSKIHHLLLYLYVFGITSKKKPRFFLLPKKKKVMDFLGIYIHIPICIHLRVMLQPLIYSFKSVYATTIKNLSKSEYYTILLNHSCKL
jgi:hypothetical protein